MPASVLDIEVLPNWVYALCVDKQGNITYEYEQWLGEPASEKGKVPPEIVTFNGLHYDLPILTAIRAGFDVEQVYEVSCGIIHGEGPYRTLKDHGLSMWRPRWHMDTQAIRLGPPGAGLKLQAARLHVPILMEMPMDPTQPMPRSKAKKAKKYCHSDCMATWWKVIKFQEVGILQTHSEIPVDRILEKTPSSAAEELWRKRAMPGRNPPPTDVATVGGYKVLDTPFRTPELDRLQKRLDGSRFKWEIGELEMQFGLGGLHSLDKPGVHQDVMFADVSSYYTSILIALDMPHPRIPNYSGQLADMRQYRLDMKAQGKQTPVEKLLLNAATGKGGDQYSCLYSPPIYKSMTLTGQFLMAVLCDMCMREGYRVYSVNTDGIVCDRGAEAVCQAWADGHDFPIEFDYVRTLGVRDVSNYTAVLDDGSVKHKGCFMPPMDLKDMVRYGTKNPAGTIIYTSASEAILECDTWLEAQAVIDDRIFGYEGVEDFIFVRLIRGGGLQRGKAVGSVARWVNVKAGGSIIKTPTGNRVPSSERALLVPDLSAVDADRIDRRWYADQAIQLWSLIRGKGSLL